MEAQAGIDSVNKINYKTALVFARRARYKTISENYCYFVFQGYRVEALSDNGSEIVCIVKGGSPRKTNDDRSFANKTIYISDMNTSVVYDNELLEKFISLFSKYTQRHSKWLQRK